MVQLFRLPRISMPLTWSHKYGQSHNWWTRTEGSQTGMPLMLFTLAPNRLTHRELLTSGAQPTCLAPCQTARSEYASKIYEMSTSTPLRIWFPSRTSSSRWENQARGPAPSPTSRFPSKMHRRGSSLIVRKYRLLPRKMKHPQFWRPIEITWKLLTKLCPLQGLPRIACTIPILCRLPRQLRTFTPTIEKIYVHPTFLG